MRPLTVAEVREDRNSSVQAAAYDTVPGRRARMIVAVVA
jgi:hypothetical protein